MSAVAGCLGAVRRTFQRPDLYSSCEPLWRASSLLGLFPFDLPPRSMRLSNARRIYSIAVFVVMAGMQVCHLTAHVSANATSHFSVYEFGLLFLYVNRALIYVLTVIPTLCKCAKVKRIFCCLSAAKYSSKQRTCVFTSVMAQMATVCVILISTYITKCSRSTGGFLHILHVFGMVGDFAIFLVIIQFVTMVTIVRINITNLNGVIKHAIRNVKTLGSPLMTLSSRHQQDHAISFPQKRASHGYCDLLSVPRIHSEVSDTADLINSTFSIQLLSIITDIFMASTYCLYGVVFKVVAEPENIPKIVAGISSFNSVLDIVVLTVNILGLWWVVSTCVSTQDQEKRSAALVHKLLDVTPDGDVRGKMEMFSLQLLHRKIEFNPCGFFAIDFTLVYSMIGACATYLLILLQFQLSYGKQ